MQSMVLIRGLGGSPEKKDPELNVVLQSMKKMGGK